jgi:hypothetical protein
VGSVRQAGESQKSSRSQQPWQERSQRQWREDGSTQPQPARQRAGERRRVGPDPPAGAADQHARWPNPSSAVHSDVTTETIQSVGRQARQPPSRSAPGSSDRSWLRPPGGRPNALHPAAPAPCGTLRPAAPCAYSGRAHLTPAPRTFPPAALGPGDPHGTAPVTTTTTDATAVAVGEPGPLATAVADRLPGGGSVPDAAGGSSRSGTSPGERGGRASEDAGSGIRRPDARAAGAAGPTGLGDVAGRRRAGAAPRAGQHHTPSPHLLRVERLCRQNGLRFRWLSYQCL